MSSPSPITIILPASNEASYIGECLHALLRQDAASGPMRIVVSANACIDGTEDAVRQMQTEFGALGHELICLSSPTPGKVGALNRAEASLPPGPRIYLDADVICDPALIGQLRQALDTDQARYATGTLAVTPAKSTFTRAYARFWQKLPFVQGGRLARGFLR